MVVAKSMKTSMSKNMITLVFLIKFEAMPRSNHEDKHYYAL